MTFEELYKHVLKSRLTGRELKAGKARKKLDCLMHPEKYPLVWKDEPCDCTDAKCVAACMFRALEIKDGKAAAECLKKSGGSGNDRGGGLC